MVERQDCDLEVACVDAFKRGNRHEVEQLLPLLRPAVARTLTRFHGSPDEFGIPQEVSSLHLAAYWGWKDIVVRLVTVHNYSAVCRDGKGNTPLHHAASKGHLEVVKCFTDELHCDPMDRNKNNTTPLHHACRNGHLSIAQYFIREAHCDPSCENKYGDTPLHCACSKGHFNTVQYLISETHCNPSCENSKGDTPLHNACLYSHTHIVQYLLSTGRVNPLAVDKYGSTPLSNALHNYDVVKLFQPFIDCSRDFPVHTFTKLILTGDSGAGKTTTAKLIKLLADRASSAVAVDCVADVQCFTVGIIPHHIKSELGNFVVYDFAGQQEYYSSHAAVLEQVMCKSAAMFFCMIDLSKSIDNISQSLHYWLTFIDNSCSTDEEASHVAIIGSHADQVTSKEMDEKSSVLKAIVASRVERQESFGYVAMDCRRADTESSRELISILSNSHKAITANQPSISYYCHVLYAFLHTKLEVVGCKLDDLMSVIASENDSSLPKDSSVLTELLTTLSDKGLILFIQHSQPKWVVVKTEVLLNKINGELFGPHSLKVYPDLASNTGVIPASSLHKVFDQYDKEMLIGFLVSLDFCRPVDPAVLQYTNLQTTLSHSTTDILFFPGLVQSERPDSLTLHGTLQFGWCLGCVDHNQFFGSRFLHLLLLSVAYQFPLAAHFYHHGPQQRCTVWKNGISWSDTNGITTVVELIDKNRWVLVVMSCSEDRPVDFPVVFAKLRSELISLVRQLQQDHRQSLQMCECLVSPSLVQRYPFDDLPDTDLFVIQDVAKSILLQKKLICSQNKACKGLSTQSLLPFEPYHLISPSYVCWLFSSDMADQPVPTPLLQEVRKHFHLGLPQVYKELREEMDKLSIFAGRNPLEVAGLREEDLVCYIDSPTAGAGDPFSILSIADLANVKAALKDLNNWLSLGLELGLLYSTLKRIEEEQHRVVDKCKTEMLAAWLQQQDNVADPSCDVLKEALRNIGENKLARELKINGQDNVADPSCDTLKEALRNIGENKLARELKINGRETNMLMKQTPKPSSSSTYTRGYCWWIIAALVIAVLAVVIGYLLFQKSS